MKEYLNSVKWNMVVISLALIVFGFFLAFKPDTSSIIICNVLGWACIALGVFCVIRYLIQDIKVSLDRNDFMIGVILIVIGIEIMIRKDDFLNLLPVFFGIIVMTSGLSKLQDGIDCARLGNPRSMIYLILAAISLVLGVVIISVNFDIRKTMFIVSGASLIYCGLSDLAATFLLSSSIIQANHPKEEKEETETPDANKENEEA
ncbi:MAG: DUF308 domain-containing protein [Erysipelotrichaceae bacterium]|nr:DUF308 domain-containing protein [Erysipelotrichaceae bacterium]